MARSVHFLSLFAADLPYSSLTHVNNMADVHKTTEILHPPHGLSVKFPRARIRQGICGDIAQIPRKLSTALNVATWQRRFDQELISASEQVGENS